MYKILARFFSEKLMIMLLIIYSISMGVGTFIENIYSTDTAKNIIYETKWFECIMLFLVICLIISINKYQLYSIKKLPLFMFHIALIIILIGASMSRYFGFEGMMLIRKGQIENTIISNKTYIKLNISQNNKIINYHDNYLISHLHYKYNGNFLFDNQIFNVKIINYIPYARETFFETHNGQKTIKLVTTNEGNRMELFIQSGQIKKIGSMIITFNQLLKNAINILEDDGKLYILSPFNGSYFKMNTGVYKTFTKNIFSNLELRSLYNINGYQFVFPDIIRTGKIKYISNNNNNNLPSAITARISTKDKFQTVTFLGDRGMLNINKSILLDGKKISIGYGSILLKLPFFLHLKNFILKKYSGSENPSSFSSQITVIDNDQKKNYNIYMNNILHYKGYKFFQSGYDSDGKGTKLSVNHDDIGSYISYIGYVLLTIGMFFTLFWKGTRFYHLHSRLMTLISKSSFILLIFFSILNIKATNLVVKDKDQGITSFININKNHANIFSKLLVQDFQGRIKPMNTMSLELLRKIYKKDNIYGLNSDQWMISMCYDGWLLSNHKISIGWIRIPFIKIGNEIIKKLYDLYHIKSHGYLSLMNLYHIDKYTNQVKFLLEDEYKNAFIKNPSQRNKYDNELISLNERINIILGIFQGKYLRIFPEKNNIYGTWQNGSFNRKDDMQSFNLMNNYFYSLYFSQKNNKWNISNHFLRKITIYQTLYGGNVIPTKNKIQYEIIYNKLNIFYKCMLSYFILSIIFIVIAFYRLFKNNNKFINKLFIITILLALIISIFHALGLIVRWYISGHAPWSNGYESAVFIAWCSILVGYIFIYSKNPFLFSMTNIIAAIILGVAHGNLMDPEITNLVPVLKSYWLMIHVSVITSSYGFLATGAFLGFIVLILYLIKGPLKNEKIDHSIEELTIINEMTITIGLFLLTIGTFLGGIWANESWGRYWSWDPKETWALISIIVYTFVLHMRLIPELKNSFIFNLFTLLAISSIIMTYFGVNYYLSGLHSYGKGDPFPIPAWIYISLAIIFFITLFSYYRNKEIIFSQKTN